MKVQQRLPLDIKMMCLSNKCKKCATKEEDERVLKYLETPEGRKELEDEYDEQQKSGMTVKKACELGLSPDPKYCADPGRVESMDALYQTKEEYMTSLDNWKAAE